MESEVLPITPNNREYVAHDLCMDWNDFLLGLICCLGSVIGFILGDRVDAKGDPWLSKYRIMFGSTVLLIYGIILITRSF